MREYSPEHQARVAKWKEERKKERKKERAANYADEAKRMAGGEKVDLPYNEKGEMKKSHDPYYSHSQKNKGEKK